MIHWATYTALDQSVTLFGKHSHCRQKAFASCPLVAFVGTFPRPTEKNGAHFPVVGCPLTPPLFIQTHQQGPDKIRIFRFLSLWHVWCIHKRRRWWNDGGRNTSLGHGSIHDETGRQGNVLGLLLVREWLVQTNLSFTLVTRRSYWAECLQCLGQCLGRITSCVE